MLQSAFPLPMENLTHELFQRRVKFARKTCHTSLAIRASLYSGPAEGEMMASHSFPSEVKARKVLPISHSDNIKRRFPDRNRGLIMKPKARTIRE